MDYVKPIGGYGEDEHKKLESIRAELAAEREKVRELEAESTAKSKHIRDMQAWIGPITTNAPNATAWLEANTTKLSVLNTIANAKLAATQLENQRLREALRCILFVVSEADNPGLVIQARDALSTPIDTTALDAYVAPWKKDAERYRWLRDNKHLDIWWSVEGPQNRCDNIDADIDAAIAAQEDK